MMLGEGCFTAAAHAAKVDPGPPPVFDKLAEQRIRAAFEAGEFDDLAGRGRPVDLDGYFSAPEDLRAAYAVLKNAGVLPEEASLLKDIHELEDRLRVATADTERTRLTRAIAQTRLKYDVIVERARTRAR
jgi:hypothetical protein